MSIDLLRSKVKKLRDSCENAVKNEIDLAVPIDKNKSIYDFGERKNQEIVRKETGQKIVFSLDKVPFIILHKNFQNNTPELSSTALNIFFDNVSKELLEQYPCYSTNNYYSSSVDIMPKVAVEWLEFARCIGLRFFAIDEMNG